MYGGCFGASSCRYGRPKRRSVRAVRGGLSYSASITTCAARPEAWENFESFGASDALPARYCLFKSASQFVTRIKGTSPSEVLEPWKRNRWPSDVTS
jgi:hypothetical protein